MTTQNATVNLANKVGLQKEEGQPSFNIWGATLIHAAADLFAFIALLANT